jgi:hypothetical protein
MYDAARECVSTAEAPWRLILRSALSSRFTSASRRKDPRLPLLAPRLSPVPPLPSRLSVRVRAAALAAAELHQH